MLKYVLLIVIVILVVILGVGTGAITTSPREEWTWNDRCPVLISSEYGCWTAVVTKSHRLYLSYDKASTNGTLKFFGVSDDLTIGARVIYIGRAQNNIPFIQVAARTYRGEMAIVNEWVKSDEFPPVPNDPFHGPDQ